MSPFSSPLQTGNGGHSSQQEVSASTSLSSLSFAVSFGESPNNVEAVEIGDAIKYLQRAPTSISTVTSRLLPLSGEVTGSHVAAL